MQRFCWLTIIASARASPSVFGCRAVFEHLIPPFCSRGSRVQIRRVQRYVKVSRDLELCEWFRERKGGGERERIRERLGLGIR